MFSYLRTFLCNRRASSIRQFYYVYQSYGKYDTNVMIVSFIIIFILTELFPAIVMTLDLIVSYLYEIDGIS